MEETKLEEARDAARCDLRAHRHVGDAHADRRPVGGVTLGRTGTEGGAAAVMVVVVGGLVGGWGLLIWTAGTWCRVTASQLRSNSRLVVRLWGFIIAGYGRLRCIASTLVRIYTQ